MKYNPHYELLEENKDRNDTKFSHNELIESMEIIEECSSILETAKTLPFPSIMKQSLGKWTALKIR